MKRATTVLLVLVGTPLAGSQYVWASQQGPSKPAIAPAVGVGDHAAGMGKDEASKTLPKYDPNSGRPFQVDVRGRNLSKLDLRGSLDDLLYADFDDRTVWPAPDRMPPGFDGHKIMELGKNPGLGVRRLHEEGISGRGVRIAIIDQPLLRDHQEYAGRVRLYEEVDLPGRTEPAMHGAAVASIALGKTAGVYALAVQADPAITPERFWALAVRTGRTIELNRNGMTKPLGPIIDPVRLIHAIQAGETTVLRREQSDNRTVPAPRQTDSETRTIVPGVRVGDCTLGMSKNEVLKKLGEPASISWAGERYALDDLPGCHSMFYGDLVCAINNGIVTGITGAGVHVGLIDQPLLLDHPEYAGKVVSYYALDCDPHRTSMHGPAMTSLLVGNRCGTAPGASLHVAAVPSWKADASYYARALDRFMTYNEGVPRDQEIRVVSVSAQPSGKGSEYANQSLWDEAVQRAQHKGILVLDCTWHHGFVSLCWLDSHDRESVEACTPGFRNGPTEVDADHIHVPSAPRTAAEAHEDGRFGYVYDGGGRRSRKAMSKGGYSDTIPYAAGILALGWQIRPDLSPEQMKDLLFASAYVHQSGAKIIHPASFIELVRNQGGNPLPDRRSSEDPFNVVGHVAAGGQMI